VSLYALTAVPVGSPVLLRNLLDLFFNTENPLNNLPQNKGPERPGLLVLPSMCRYVAVFGIFSASKESLEGFFQISIGNACTYVAHIPEGGTLITGSPVVALRKVIEPSEGWLLQRRAF